VDGKVAIVLNTGSLIQPLTRTQYRAGQPAPSGLYSHSDQTVQAQTGHAVPNGSGWGGRCLDVLEERGNLAAISVTYPSLYLQGQFVSGNTFGPGSSLNLSGMSFNPKAAATARRQALEAVLALDGGSPLRKAANQVFLDGLKLSDTLKELDNSLAPLTTAFPANNQLSNQFKEVIRQIRLRKKLGTSGRQVFFCSIGSFDTHDNQKGQHRNLLIQLSQAVDAFYKATVEIGAQNEITCFTQSEFGRTLLPSSAGTNHAWGNHHFIIGGAVKSGIYGTLPEFALGGPDDASSYGVWIPKIATAQYGATLASWFGASTADLPLVFPGLGNFASSNLGFML
jgi:uncharacterized protein (DUF1501 family)